MQNPCSNKQKSLPVNSTNYKTITSLSSNVIPTESTAGRRDTTIRIHFFRIKKLIIP